MSVGHIIGTLSEPVSNGICLLFVNNKIACSGFSLIVHEFIVEPLVDAPINACLESFIKDPTLQNIDLFDPYNFGVKLVGSYATSKAAESYFGESILVSTIFGVTGSYLADSLYNTNFSGSLTRCQLGEDCFDDLILMPMVRSVTGSYLADAVYNSIYASNTVD